MLPGAPAQQTYWQQEVHYTIDVSLNDTDHTLSGFLRLNYINHSPDTLSYIWFHCWPNAFRNDRTAFSEQLLQSGRTDFYFSAREERGYMNRLDFRTDNRSLRSEDHPQYIDVLKVYLAEPLPPGGQTTITTPFHVQLPHTFSRMGHTGQSYQVAYWYPKPAVYDRNGWHPMPYLNQGEGYGEFGSFDVRITLPEEYIVAATGELSGSDWKQETRSEQEWQRFSDRMKALINTEAGNPSPPLKGRKLAAGKGKAAQQEKPTLKNNPPPKPVFARVRPTIIRPPSQGTKTLRYRQDRVHDFAWFADRNFIVSRDTVQLGSGRIVQAFTFYTPEGKENWKNSIDMLKDAIRFRSSLVGEYPYTVVSAVETPIGFDGGMEYPTITSIAPGYGARELDLLIGHEVGHNWFYGILGSNERDHPWMDEGINTYYDKRYERWKYGVDTSNWAARRLPEDPEKLVVASLIKIKKDQPISTPSTDFTPLNYSVIAYTKTAIWMQELESMMGTRPFDSAMQAYYRQWQFRHPAPADFRETMQERATADLGPEFSKLDSTGGIMSYKGPKKIRPAFLFSLKDYERVHYVNWLPAAGYNMYDGFMAGLLIHNYTLPPKKFQFLLSPLYATNSKQLNGLGQFSYQWWPGKKLQKVELGAAGARFSSLDGTDSSGHKVFGGFHKIAPYLRVTFRNRHNESRVEKWLEWRTFFIGEQGFNYVMKQQDSVYYPKKGGWQNRYLNQLTFQLTDYRALYPYDVQLQVQQGEGFYRATATAHYFMNYAQSGGMHIRVFAAKFGYLGEKTPLREFATAIYQPKLTAVRGNEDYTYSNYFIGRNEFEGFASQQVMMRDGGLKLRTDLFQDLQGRSDDWVASLNLNTTLPENIFPPNFPVRLFVDVGTYAQAWKKDASLSKFLYVGGLQLTLFKELLNVYAPILYSKEFRDNLKTVPEENKFFKKISFSIDIHRFNLKKIINNQFLY